MSDKSPNTSGSEEVDLGQLFKLIGNAFERFFKFLGVVLNKLFLSFVWIVFFLKKHFLKIFLAGVIGFGITFIKEKISGPVFVSSISVTQNYSTGENLYDLVDYYNSLLKQKDSSIIDNVSKDLFANSKDIISFEIEPIINENTRIKDYDKYIKDLDSALTANIDYEMYLKNTMEHEYGQQKISIKAKTPKNLLPVFKGMIEMINSSEFFKTRQQRDLDELTNKELALKQAIIESDSLKNTYKRVLEKQHIDKKNEAQTSVTVEAADNNSKTKEFDLYKNDLELRRELVSIERQKQEKEEILEIISSEFTSGVVNNSINIFGKNISRKIIYALLFSLIASFLLIIIEANKFLENYKD